MTDKDTNTNKDVGEDVVLLRLNTGEEIVSFMNGATSELRNPLIIHIQMDAQGRAMASFYPYIPNAWNKTCIINNQHVQAFAVPDEKLLENYLVSVGEKPNIIKPDNKIVVPTK